MNFGGLISKIGGMIPGIGTAISAIGLAGDIFGRFGAAKRQKELANKINPVDPAYQESEYAKQQLARAQQAYGGRMAGASAMQNNIANAQGNMMANVARNSTNSADNLAMAAAGAGQANQAYANLATAEAQDKVQRDTALRQSEGLMVQEGDKVFRDKIRKYTEAVQAKNDLMRASIENKSNAWNSVARSGLLMMQAGKKNAPGGVVTPSPGGSGVAGGGLGGFNSFGSMISSAVGAARSRGAFNNPAGAPYPARDGYRNWSMYPPADQLDTDTRWRSILGG